MSSDDWRHTAHQLVEATSGSAFDAFSSDPPNPAAGVLYTPSASSTAQHSTGQQDRDSSFSSSSSALGVDQPLPFPLQHPFAGGQPDSAPMSRKPSLSLSTGSRAPSLPPPQNLSTNSLSSLASGGAGLGPLTGRGSGPALQQVNSRANVSEADGEAKELRRQLHQMADQHEEALRKLSAEHEAHLAAVHAQAVAKMKELIEKVSQGLGCQVICLCILGEAPHSHLQLHSSLISSLHTKVKHSRPAVPNSAVISMTCCSFSGREVAQHNTGCAQPCLQTAHSD